MQDIFHIVHILVAVGLIGLILIQHGKGADAGAAFGSGASSTVFGSQGSASFLTRTTAILATVFFVSCLILAYFSSQVKQPESVMETISAPAIEQKAVESEVPMVDAPSDIAIPNIEESATTAPSVEVAPVTPVAEKPATPVVEAPAVKTTPATDTPVVPTQ